MQAEIVLLILATTLRVGWEHQQHACSWPTLKVEIGSQQLVMQYKIRENSWMARIAARKMKAHQLAMVWGTTIHLHNTSVEEFLSDQRWLRHELKHIEQFRQHGFLPFLIKYTWECIRVGYYNNRFEKEARAAEKTGGY